VQALRAGVVPRVGLPHVQVGRAREVQQVARDVERIREGGSAVRFVIGDYGSGKTFFLYLARSIALEQKLVTAHVDLSPSRRLHATGGQARGLYAALMASLATRAKPEGGALASIVERFVDDARGEAGEKRQPVGRVIRERLGGIQALASGPDFATVLERYCTAFEQGDDDLKAAALRWLRGEYTTKSEAREALGVRMVVDDATIYDHLRLMARFVRLAGYDGLLVVLDEMVNLHRLVNAQARNANYELILRIVNDVLQGNAGHFGIFFGGTPEFLADGRRGLYSYEALRSRLAENSFARGGLIDLQGPVLRLQSLTPEEFHVLLEKLRHVFAGGDSTRYLIPDEALVAFARHCEGRIGAAYFRTPRETIRSFLGLLAVLEQNPGTSWQDLIGRVEVEADRPSPLSDITDDEPATAAGAPRRPTDDLADFRL
jgi:hypothetical protein